MFESLNHAQNVAANYLPQEAIAPALDQLIPAIGVRPSVSDHTGGTRLGGTPDVAISFQWPTADLSDVTDLDQYLSPNERPTGPEPLWFVAQIDLAEAHALGEIAAPLPTNGRLLFFYDLLVGPLANDPKAVQVIWDTTVVTELTNHPAPTRLAERANHLSAAAKPGELFAGFALPQRGSCCPETEPLFDAIDAGNHPLSPYDEAFDEFCIADGPFVEPMWRHHQMLGSPVPCQTDPRGYLEHDNTSEWVQLLCYACEDLGEGEVFFLIHRDDLQVRDFSKVEAVYLQT